VGRADFGVSFGPSHIVVCRIGHGHLASDHATFVNWVQTPAVTVLLVLLLAFLFYHAALGIEVIVDDYVHSGLKFAAIVVVRLGCFAIAVAGIVATLRIAFSA
jgi:succinate dehydrogenase / fumarate reductase membrane anchor subunit